MKLKILFMLLVGLLSQGAQAVVVTLGNGANCDYDFSTGATLVQALNHPSVTEIRIERNLSLNPVALTFSIKLIGGYDDCDQAANSIDISGTAERTTISGQNVQQSVRIFSTNPLDIELHNLIIENGNAGTLATNNGGGIEAVGNGQVSLLIQNSEIQNNLAFAGAGIYFDGGSGVKQLMLHDVQVHSNQAENNQGSGFHGGGGIFINNTELTITGASQIRDNNIVAQGNGSSVGGGIFAANSTITIIGDANSANSGVMNNTAELRGGGLYLGGNVDLLISGSQTMVAGVSQGSDQFPVVISNNQATIDGGGGIYAVTSNVSIESAMLQQNSAALVGGAILSLNSTVDVVADAKRCWNDLSCNQFKQNNAQRGGAIFNFGSSGQLNVQHALFHDNSADIGTTLYNDNGGISTFESVVIAEEGLTGTTYNDEDVIHTIDASTTINYATVVENQVTDAVFTALDGGLGNRVNHSIVYNTNPTVMGAENNGISDNQYSCLLTNVNENGSINIGSINYSNLFEDASQLDFRLRMDAYVIDFCDGDALAPTTYDMQGRIRGVDDPLSTNIFGEHDAGAYEFYDDDVIFFQSLEF